MYIYSCLRTGLRLSKSIYQCSIVIIVMIVFIVYIQIVINGTFIQWIYQKANRVQIGNKVSNRLVLGLNSHWFGLVVHGPRNSEPFFLKWKFFQKKKENLVTKTPLLIGQYEYANQFYITTKSAVGWLLW